MYSTAHFGPLGGRGGGSSGSGGSGSILLRIIRTQIPFSTARALLVNKLLTIHEATLHDLRTPGSHQSSLDKRSDLVKDWQDKAIIGLGSDKKKIIIWCGLKYIFFVSARLKYMLALTHCGLRLQVCGFWDSESVRKASLRFETNSNGSVSTKPGTIEHNEPNFCR